MTGLDNPGIRRLLVLSHPNHEAAIFGIVQRLRPMLVVLTDGGGDPRPGETRKALERVGLLDHVRFLDFREGDFYRALLERDLDYFRNVIARLSIELKEFTPEQVICDAVEFYNPVHDLSLPILRAALAAVSTVQVFEAPLIHQAACQEMGNAASYELQRFPNSRRGGQIEFHLTKDELGVKLAARDQVYSALRKQIGALLDSTQRIISRLKYLRRPREAWRNRTATRYYATIGGRSSSSPEGRSSARSRASNTMFRWPPRSSLTCMQTQRVAFNPRLCLRSSQLERSLYFLNRFAF